MTGSEKNKMIPIIGNAQNETYIENPEQSKKLKKYSESKPYTHPFPCGKETLRTIENKTIYVRKPIGFCWAGSFLRANACLEIKSIEHRNAKLAAAADAYLLARRQVHINAAICASKVLGVVPALAIGTASIATPAGIANLAVAGVAGACIAPPLEGTIDAHQTKKIMKKILTDNGINTKRYLRKIDFSKMTLQARCSVNDGLSTPMRNDLSTNALPKNTKKTRRHLNQVFADNPCRLNKLERIILSSDSYFDASGRATTEGCHFSEKGWRDLLKLCVIEQVAN
ncbi:hypothetical protein [Endozoicomonas atrinae]|uniref:hypothetical protein n=1 Tax=Endozoicomonas atrinae TaxID=1333660 RepID=UPI000826CA85|nr:hypothetical protein [Endozoicomonas atrinae]